MAIEFHCEHCGKKVRTKDEAAGKRGRCPYCKQSVYIPMRQAEIEPLDLAPLDESDEKKRDSLHKETTKLTGSILRDTKAPPEVSAVPKIGSSSGDSMALPKDDMETMVIEYASCMARGELGPAAELAEEIRKDSKAADEVIQRISMDEMPPSQLASIPRPVLMGFFKRLRAR